MLFLTPRRQYPSWLYPGASDRDPDACPRLGCSRSVLDPLAPDYLANLERMAAAIVGGMSVSTIFTVLLLPKFLPSQAAPIDEVMRAQEDLVAIEHTLRQVVCVKG